ncbi:family 43 glycosylhydrolase [Enterococcus gallinarum]|uniref:family 43 glycosylhydrolase n=1 Tax=Enterococcus gallinarum TaxID=1353 RepID=UPI00255ADD75|nr:family 43 glycosylhydrolase [Enterococcus gallinarum]MDL4908436.1 family 43 glycosylhydrolase [Enterococcus gallinarum]
MAERIEHIQSTDVLNIGRDKINKFAIDPAIRAEQKSAISLDLSTKALNQNKETQNQVDSLIIEAGTSDAETIQARGNYDLLYKRLDDSEMKNGQLSSTFLMAFFRDSDSKGVIYKSTDGKKVEEIDVQFETYLRDPSLIFFEGYFYIASTNYNPHDFVLYRSKNLVDWDKIDVSLGLYLNNEEAIRVWAPELNILNNEVYVTISCQTGTSLDQDDKAIPSFRPYMAKASDLFTGSFDKPIELRLNEDDSNHANKIDGTIVQYLEVFYLFIKDEYDKKIEIWTSTDLISWEKVSDWVESLGQYVEGPCIVYDGTIFRLYADAFREKVTYFVESKDLLNWSETKQKVDAPEPIRHGSTYLLNTPDEFRVANNAFFAKKNTSKKFFYQKTAFSGSVIDNVFFPTDNAIYVVANNENFEINEINNQYLADTFFVYLATSSVGSVIFKSGLSVSNYEISVDRSMNDTLYEFKRNNLDGLFYPTSPQGKKYSKGNHLATLTPSNVSFKGSVRMRRNCNSIELVFENVKFDAMNGTGVIGALPVMYRPAGQRKVRIASDDTGSDQFSTIVIEESGEVKVTRTSNLASTYNGNIMYFANE